MSASFGYDKRAERRERRERRRENQRPDHSIISAIWLIGLGILFFTGRWWPGILVLIGINMVVGALLGAVHTSQVTNTNGEWFSPTQDAARVELSAAQQPAQTPIRTEPVPAVVSAPVENRYQGWLPDRCDHCGAPVNPRQVTWQGSDQAACSYCGSILSKR